MKQSNGPPPCDVTADELIAYQDRALPAERLAELDHHVPACPRCQTQLDESAAIGNLIRYAAPSPSPQEIEIGRARLIDRLREEQAAFPSPAHRERGMRPSHMWRVAVVLLLLAGLGTYALIPRESWADFPLARIVGFTIDEDAKESAPSLNPDSQGQPTDLDGSPTAAETDGALQSDGALQFEPVAPEALPGGFELGSQTSAGPDAVGLEYQHASGLRITVTESVATSADTAIDRERYQTASAGTIQVLYLFVPGVESISHAVWTDGGLLYSLLVPVFSRTEALHLETLLLLVEGFAAASQK